MVEYTFPNCPCIATISARRGIVFWIKADSRAGIGRPRAAQMLEEAGFDIEQLEAEVLAKFQQRQREDG
jgi:hypothetical protein